MNKTVLIQCLYIYLFTRKMNANKAYVIKRAILYALRYITLSLSGNQPPRPLRSLSQKNT